jgi:hypothetical protein
MGSNLNNCTSIYFGKYINDNIISLDILNDTILEYLKNNFEQKGIVKKKIYQHNNLYYEIINNKHKCFKKNNLRIKEFKKNNIVTNVISYDKKNIDLDVFPSFTDYLNEEEFKITKYGDNIELISNKNCNYLVLNKNDPEIINNITKILN